MLIIAGVYVLGLLIFSLTVLLYMYIYFFVLMIAIIAVTTLKASLILFGRKDGWTWVHFALGLRASPQKRILFKFHYVF